MKIEQTLNAASKLSPMQITDDESARDRERGEYMKCFRKRPIRARQQPLKDAFRIDRQQLPVKKIPILKLVAVDGCKLVPNRSGIEQPLVLERFQKRFDRCERNRRIQFLRCSCRQCGSV